MRFQRRDHHAFMHTDQLVPKTMASNPSNLDKDARAVIAGPPVHHFDTIQAEPSVAARKTRRLSRLQLIVGFLLFNAAVWLSVLWIALRW